jgi:hypothetical protein
MRITPLTNISGTPSVAKLQKTLGLWHIIIIGLAYIQPMTLFDTFGLVSEESHHHVPTSYIVALIAILFIAKLWAHDSPLSIFWIGLYLRSKINPSKCWLYGGVVFLARLFTITDGQYHLGGNLSGCLISKCKPLGLGDYPDCLYDWHQPVALVLLQTLIA